VAAGEEGKDCRPGPLFIMSHEAFEEGREGVERQAQRHNDANMAAESTCSCQDIKFMTS